MEEPRRPGRIFDENFLTFVAKEDPNLLILGDSTLKSSPPKKLIQLGYKPTDFTWIFDSISKFSPQDFAPYVIKFGQ